MNLKPLVATSLLALASLGTHAATTDWGTHGLLESSLGLTAGGVIYDKFTFTLLEMSTVASSVTSLGNIAPASYGIFNADDTATPYSWNFGGAPTVNEVTLSAGSYYYYVFGFAPSVAAYSINSAAVATPVPEPETYAMLLAGLGVVGFVARRRRAD